MNRRDRTIGGSRRMGVNLTPMIDVVFQLLIYFMLATNFALGEQVFRLDLPQRGGVVEPEDPFHLPEEPLRIVVRSEGPGEEDVGITIEGPYPQPADLRQLEAFLVESRAMGGRGYFLEDHPVIIVPGKSTSWGHVVDVFNAAVRAGYLKVRFADPTDASPR